MPDGFVLAGGASRRMGRDKARVVVDGRPMALRVADALGAVCGRVALVRREPDVWPIEVVSGVEGPGRHALWGVAVALEAAATELVVIAPCDLPWLTGEALALLVEAAPCVAWDGERVHPLLAVLPASFAPTVRQIAAAGGSARELAGGFRQILLPAGVLRNVNRPDDLDVS